MKNLKVSAKLSVGFGVSAVFLLIVSVVSVVSLRNLTVAYKDAIEDHGVPLAYAAQTLGAIHALRAETRGCILFIGDKDKIRDGRNEIDGLFKQFEAAVEKFGKPLLEHHEAKVLFTDAMEKYERVFKQSVYKILDGAARGAPKEELLAEMAANAKPAEDLISTNMKKCMEMDLEELHESTESGHSLAQTVIIITIILTVLCFGVAIFLGIYISGMISKPLQSAVKMVDGIGHGHLDMRLKLNRSDEIGIMAKTLDKLADDLQNEFLAGLRMISVGDLSAKVMTMDEKDEIGGTLKKTMEALRDVVDAMKKISVGDLSIEIKPKGDKDEISEALKRTVESLRALIIDDGGMVLQAAANNDLSQRLTREYTGEFARMKDNINTVMQNLDDAIAQVGAAVAQVTTVSAEISYGAQNLAEGSSEQASSLEEVSASLEEISSMTKQNADNSNQAKILASEARSAANEGDTTMRRMAAAINQIKLMSDNTVKIIKTIDDIAFQTNLLALNAAVEAARAGEAGKGFAVVAEEVRNLAMLSAEAANNTAKMIEESVKNADGGVKITEEVAKSLGHIVDRTARVNDLIGEIAAASGEQSQGIEQVNIAVAQMNQITQRNAASSEESASASEELSSQASELANMVHLFKLSSGGGLRSVTQQVGANYHGNDVRRGGIPSLPTAKPAKPSSIPNRRAGGFPSLPNLNSDGGRQDARRGLPPQQTQASTVKSARAIKPEEIIPLDDDDLGEF
ncbi:MAG: methyl-accepting chemotaxis protein [Chitinispirillales bacterium]|jgi:methyl-accepting chemotaxis protein|nr:methyl-accepting chemotaxis protein [Chitinispirillales bacterium]